MDLEQLMGRYSRLRHELWLASQAHPQNSARIERLADDLAATAREIARLQPTDEQCNDSLLGFAH